MHRLVAHALVLVAILFGGCLCGLFPDPASADGVTGRVEVLPRRFDDPEARLQAYLEAAAAEVAPEPQEALKRILSAERRLLALRGYLRAGKDVRARWAWSDVQIATYQTSPEYELVLAEVEKVKKSFASLNPGYSLRVNTNPRSLEQQLLKWNQVESVGRAAQELVALAQAELAKPDYETVEAKAVQRFARFVRGSTLQTRSSLAVPGFSAHGQMRAFDFQVMRGAELIAGTSTASAAESWDQAGWTQRLQEAVRLASARFHGPLETPREPWHYEYRP